VGPVGQEEEEQEGRGQEGGGAAHGSGWCVGAAPTIADMALFDLVRRLLGLPAACLPS
jgi:glutathione S-transferase